MSSQWCKCAYNSDLLQLRRAIYSHVNLKQLGFSSFTLPKKLIQRTFVANAGIEQSCEFGIFGRIKSAAADR